jgi:protein-tyrosine kinase
VSIIEQAARRLEELRRSGVEVPWRTPGGDDSTKPFDRRGPDHAVGGPEEGRVQKLHPMRPANAQRQSVAPGESSTGSQSRRVHVDLGRLGAMGYLTPETPRAQVADEFRVIKRPLLVNVNGRSGAAPAEKANLIMVTSSVPGEGKTFVSINLAISMAMELDRTVLLVDADVSRPALLPRLGLSVSTGLLDVLADPTIPLSDVLLRTNIEKLTILPAGAPRGRATEMLASEAMVRLLAEMASRYPDRIIVFDAPPLLPSTESRVLATHMGQVILVVEAERTPQKVVRQALGTIESCPVVMPLLNKASHSDVGFYYGTYGPVDS